MILVDEDILNDPRFQATREMEIDPSFVPCRDESCTILSLHREHLTGERGRKMKRCPSCGGKIVRSPRKRGYCCNPLCSWRAVTVNP